MPTNKMLLGRKIVGVSWLSEAEAKKQGIPNYDVKRKPVQKIELDDGNFITALADPEGNGPGFLILGSRKGESWYVNPPKQEEDDIEL